YQWKQPGNERDYKLKAGLAFRNMGSMTFKSGNNRATNYILNVPSGSSLNLNQFQDVSSLEEIETLLLASGYLNSAPVRKDFRVKLPATFSAYADIKIVPDLYVTVYGQRKLNKDSANDQVTTQNVLSATPRYSIKSFEVFAPLASNEISGFTSGLGFAAGGFFIGSGSLITALADGGQADAYLGFRFGIQ
ncbi:MAG TPA: hypothetical protein VFR70_05440, partial [Flavobacterium sp.]|nr:hypothetical protein [Flavobacterium sp.]